MATVNYSTRVEAGTKTAPGYSFRTDTDSGVYLIGANNVGISVGDTKIVDISTSGVAITGTLAVTGASTLTGNVGIGAASNSGVGLYVQSAALAGVAQQGIYVLPVFTATGTTLLAGVRARVSTAAAAFTTAEAIGILVDDVTLGAGSAATKQYGVFVSAQTKGGTNWAVYTVGTAPSQFGGAVTSVSATGGIGYGTGAGGAVTQGTGRTTGVTLNKVCGAITLVSAAGSATAFSFTVTNSTVAATDAIWLSQKSGTDKYVLLVTAVAAGSFQITAYTTGGTTTEQPVINFAVCKAVAA